jgi:hypothetical protein
MSLQKMDTIGPVRKASHIRRGPELFFSSLCSRWLNGEIPPHQTSNAAP